MHNKDQTKQPNHDKATPKCINKKPAPKESNKKPIKPTPV